MRLALPLVFCAAPLWAEEVQTRCGWYDNPTPANYWVEDAHAVWALSVQGMGEAPGFYDAADAAGGRLEWVLMQPAGYGYGCACVDGVFGEIDAKGMFGSKSGEVLRVDRLTYLPLQQCAADPALPERDLRPMAEE